MCDKNNFRQLHSALCRALTDSRRAKKTTDEFAALTTNGERVNYVLRLLGEFELFARVKGEFKSDTLSCEFRNKGNELFRVKKDEMALEMYTRSIAYAPNGEQCLGMAYANRSAVLLEKKLYRECLSVCKQGCACNLHRYYNIYLY